MYIKYVVNSKIKIYKIVVVEFIKEIINTNYQFNYDLPILYGGSVNSKNSSEIFEINNVDGVLVGGASLKSDEFLKIIENSM